MNSISRADASEEPLDRLRRLIEAGKWPPNYFYNGDTNEKLHNQSSSNLFNNRITRTKFRYICLFTGIVGFVMGFIIGTMLPNLLTIDNNKNFNQNISISVLRNDSKNHTNYDRVTFVRESPRLRSINVIPVRTTPEKSNSEKISKNNNNDSVVNGIYWGDIVESALPAGFTEEDTMEWRTYTRNVSVVQIKEGCGRMQNRLLKFSDGTISCCRYRRNTDQIQGELFSFYLAQTLGLRNLVPTTLSLVKMRSENDTMWSNVKSDMMLAQWAEDKPVVLTKFIPNIVTAYIPFNFRNSNRRLHPIDVSYNASQISSETLQNLVELAQWSDMIIFDYLTANLDRVVNNLYNLQWNFAMMDSPTHNLKRTIRDKLLIFLDNESGLLHGYRLLDKYESYHSALLDSLCVFRKSTADVIKKLKKQGNVGEMLQNQFNKYESDLKDYLPGLPDKSVQILNERISRVFDVIEKCESMFMSNEV